MLPLPPSAVTQAVASSSGGDHVRSNATFHRSISKSTRERVSGGVRGIFKERCITDLDFVPERRPLTIRNGRFFCRCGPAPIIESFD